MFLASLAALPPLSIDLALPALKEISINLHASLGAVGLTLSLFMAGFAGAPLVYGPLSDRFGRRPVLLVGVTIFAAGGIAATLAPSISLLLIARFFEGAGAGVGLPMAFAIIRDLFEGPAARTKLSYMLMVSTLAPVLAPSLGAIILSVAGWRSIYGLLAGGGLLLVSAVAFGFSESHPVTRPQGPLFGQVMMGYKALFRSRVGMGFALVFGLSFGVLFAFISGSPLVFMGHFGVSAHLYGFIFAACAGGISAGAFIDTRLSGRGISGTYPLRAGFAIYLIASVTMLGLEIAGQAGVFNLLPLLVLSAFAYGLISPNASLGTMQALPEIAGIASAILTSLQMFVGVIASAVVAAAYATAGVLAMLVPMFGFGLAAFLVYLTTVRSRATPSNP
jgi:DHA1 family bicyclomycin/chloramphenicol resistance-like MFS transporter